jgi:hypothetical protein
MSHSAAATKNQGRVLLMARRAHDCNCVSKTSTEEQGGGQVETPAQSM